MKPIRRDWKNPLKKFAVFLKAEFDTYYEKTTLLFSVFIFAGVASAQTKDETFYSEGDVEEVVTLGTRVTGKALSESTAPVEIINEEEIRATGHTEVGRIIQTIVASFNFSSSSISDGTDSLRPATLRGLGPDTGSCSCKRQKAARQRAHTHQQFRGTRNFGIRYEFNSSRRDKKD